VSKRTLYQRFQGKPPLFGAVLQRLVARLRPPDIDVERLFEGPSLRVILTKLAERVLEAALVPEAIALNRMIVAEAARFPEVAEMANQMGARQEAVERIAALLQRDAPKATSPSRARFAAEQFLQMVIASPQRRALGLGPPMSAADRRAWARDTVALFLDGHAARPRG
jgi:AcrR family transcriptional regulator